MPAESKCENAYGILSSILLEHSVVTTMRFHDNHAVNVTDKEYTSKHHVRVLIFLCVMRIRYIVIMFSSLN